MSKYRLKAHEVEAVQFTGQPEHELPQWVGEYTAHTPVNGKSHVIYNHLLGKLMVPTTEGHTQCLPGDWLVFNGMYISVVKGGSFNALYEPVEDTVQEAPTDES